VNIYCNDRMRGAASVALVSLMLAATGAAAQSPKADNPARMPVPRGAAAQPAAPAAQQPPARSSTGGQVVPLDRVIAVVNDDAVTQFDLDTEKNTVLRQMKAQNVTPPPNDVLEKQLLERMIVERSLQQYAKETGVRVDDVQVERTITRIAQDNKLSAEDFRKAVQNEGMTYAKYREDIRNELLVQRLRDREVDSKLTVTDAEVDAFLATQAAQAGGDVEYHLAHVLVIVPEQASPEQIDAKRRRAEDALKQISGGQDFAQVAAGFSDAPDALKGGDMGWRAPARLPTVFAEPVRNMKAGEVSGVLRSANGFHIVKLVEVKNTNAPTVVQQEHARHILIKVNEVTSEAGAKTKIERVRDRIESGAKFEDQARLSSEDGSASKGGDLGWISPGDTVPDFERAMEKLKIDEVSPPVRTPFGWHLIQVLERRTQDVTAERRREQARSAIRQRKSEEAFQDWVRQMRDRAYVEIKTDER